MTSPKCSVAPISLFYSYSHKDEALRGKLEVHLSLLQTQGVICSWHDRRIEAGTEWDGAISKNLDEADIVLLLVSADFLASRYCHEVEIARAMERHEAGTARVIPVILRPVVWHFTSFGKLQALPKDAKPVTTWKNRDAAFADVARGIHEAVKSLTAGTDSVTGAHPSEPGGIDRGSRGRKTGIALDERPDRQRMTFATQTELLLLGAVEFVEGGIDGGVASNPWQLRFGSIEPAIELMQCL